MKGKNWTWTRYVLTWAVVVFSLGACSGEPATNEAIERADAAASVPGCELITGAEIQDATGVAADRSEDGSSAIRGCSWYTADGRPLVGVTVGAAHV